MEGFPAAASPLDQDQALTDSERYRFVPAAGSIHHGAARPVRRVPSVPSGNDDPSCSAGHIGRSGRNPTRQESRSPRRRRLFGGRVRDGVGTIQKEDGDLLIRLDAGIHGAMNAVTRLVPMDPAGCERGTRWLPPWSRYSITSKSPERTTVTRWKGSRCHGVVSPGARRNRRTSVVPRR